LWIVVIVIIMIIIVILIIVYGYTASFFVPCNGKKGYFRVKIEKNGSEMACSEKHILNNVSKFISINLSCLVNCIIDSNE